jgi:general secretion pathway protein C
MKRWPLIASFVLFVALCASTAYWAMQWFTPPARPVAAPLQETQAVADPGAAASLFGGHSIATLASNFQLKGVVMASDPNESVAILAVNGKPAQAIRTNTEVIPGVTVKEVHKHHVLLIDSGVIKRVELPAKAPRK